MPTRRRMSLRWLLAVVVVLLGTPALTGMGAVAAALPAGSTGHDVSYPQCGAALPTSGSFGVVGVTNGIAYSGNPCLAAQWRWASGLPGSPSLYTTPANPAPTSSHYWPVSGARDPALCTDAASTTDPGCAYDYGWHAAADAMSTATAAIANAATTPWWLDVETGNTYNGDGVSNAADLQGMIDYLRGRGVPSVGFYSTGFQWSSITGGWTAASDPSYRAKWANEFTPVYPMTDGPTWVAGASSLSEAQANCSSSFTGGVTTLAQYPDGGVDGDVTCPTTTPAPTPTPNPTATVPSAPLGVTAATAASGPGTTLTWQPPTSTGGAPVSSYTVYRSTSSGKESAYATVSCATGPCTSYQDNQTKSGRRYYYQVAATNSVGAGPRSQQTSAVAR